MDKWGLGELRKKIEKRDKLCAFCRVKMRKWHSKGPRGKAPTIEHLDNDENNKDESNIVMCCTSCNSSKGEKELRDWLKSDYCKCKEKNITEKTIKNVIVKKFLKEHKK
ncbi:MAG: HNH endonuclease [Candidatus Margulisiibacteriota bacterium]